MDVNVDAIVARLVKLKTASTAPESDPSALEGGAMRG
jgi:hypothetical protein